MFEHLGLEHGGRVQQAAKAYQIPLKDWLDLSTGINPIAWPVPELNPLLWRCLPEEQDGLAEIAGNYYGCNQLLPVPGSQAAIQCLPKLRDPCRVGVLSPGYNEHVYRWREAGHQVLEMDYQELESSIDELDVVIIARPNNPNGLIVPLVTIKAWLRELSVRGGWLIVDEAFIDATGEQSVLTGTLDDGLIVLRSLGKFFGLAGARVGFVFADVSLLQQMHLALGPWSISHPSRWIAAQALQDSVWQQQSRERLKIDALRLEELLTKQGLPPNSGSTLFQLTRTPKAAVIFDRLASQGVLVRIFRPIASLRFGLPGSESGWKKLDGALTNSQ